METSRYGLDYKHGTIMLSVLSLVHNYDHFITGTRFVTRFATRGQFGWVYTFAALDTREENMTLTMGEKGIRKHFKIEKD